MTSKINKNSVSKFFDDSYRFRWAVMIGVTIIFTFILYPNLILIKHSYQLGDVAERDIKAPKDFLIEDIQATETNRKQAAEKVLTVYDHDTALSFALTQRVNQAFADLQAVFNTESANKDSAKKPKTDSSIATGKNRMFFFNHNTVPTHMRNFQTVPIFRCFIKLKSPDQTVYYTEARGIIFLAMPHDNLSSQAYSKNRRTHAKCVSYYAVKANTFQTRHCTAGSTDTRKYYSFSF